MKSTPRPSLSQMPVLLADFRLLLILFVTFRLTLVIVYQPLIVQGVERGIAAGGDFQTYFNIASLSERVGLPLIDWWSEFPPLWSYLSMLIYQAQGAAPVYTGFALFLSLIFILCDAGNLILIRRIGARLYGPETSMAITWIYALLVAPLIFVFWTFEVLVTFFLLFGLWQMIQNRAGQSALVTGIGGLFKFTPLLLLGAVWRHRSQPWAVRWTLMAMGLIVLVYLPFFARNAAMTLPSLTAQFNKASYQTVWALLDGNFRTGNFGPLTDRLDPARAEVLQGNPAVVPGWLRLGAAALIGLFIFSRTRRFDDRGLLAFAAATFLLFFLQAQGWSPQWLAQIIPLVLLALPNRDVVIGIALLSLITFVEYPFLFIRTGETGGQIAGTLVAPFTLLVLARTAILAGIVVALYRLLRQQRDTGRTH